MLAVVLALGVAALSLVVRPWAYEQSYRLRAEAGAEVDLDRFKAGRFYAKQRGEHVVFAESGDTATEGRLAGVFVHNEERGIRRVVFAESAFQRVDPVTRRPHAGHAERPPLPDLAIGRGPRSDHRASSASRCR